MIKSVEKFLKAYAVFTATILLSVFLLNAWVHKLEYEAGQQYRIDTQVQLTAANLLQALTDRETGQRGYILTLDKNFLEPYREAGERLTSLTNALKPHIPTADWQWMVSQIRSRNTYFDSTFEKLASSDPLSGQMQAIELVRTGTGEAYMEAFRDTLDRLLSDRQRASDQEQRKLERLVLAAKIVGITSLFILLVLALLPLFLLRRKLVSPLRHLGSALNTFVNTRKLDFKTSDCMFSEVEKLVEDTALAARSLLQAEQELSVTLEDLKHQSLYLQLSSQAMNLGLWRFNKLNNEIFWNTAYRRMMGVEHDKPIALDEAFATWLNRVHPDDREGVLAEIESMEHLPIRVSNTSMKYRIVDDSGAYRWLYVQLNFDRAQSGEIKQIAAAVLDVTNEELNRQAIEKQLAHAQALNNLGTLSRWEYDPQTQATYFDEVMRNWSGLNLRPNEPYSLNSLCDAMTQKERQAYRRSIKGMIESLVGQRDSTDYTFEHQLKDRVVQVRAERVRVDGRDWILGCSVDVTDLIERQRQLEQLLANEEIATQRQREMFAIIGHELRTPVASIEMITSDEEIDFESQRQHVNAIAHSLLNILEDLRVVVSPDRALEAKPIQANPTDTLSRALLPLVPLVEAQGLKLTSELPYTDNHIYLFNAQALRQIVTNLVKNAAFHSQGSSVQVELEIIPREAESATARLVVRDDGTGIPETSHESLFKAFSRGEGRQDGSGLGLFIVRELVNKIEGTLELHNVQSGGTCFEIEFPIYQADAPVEASEVNAYEALKGLKIMLAEDEATLRLLSARALEKRGAIVDTFENGALALEGFKRGAYDLVITDLMMPEMDGHALTRAIRSTDTAIPIIAVTAAVLGVETDQFIELGANAVIPKPINVKRVAEELRRVRSAASLS